VADDQTGKVMTLAEAEARNVERAKLLISEWPFVTGTLSFLSDRAAALRWLILTLTLLADVTLFRWMIELSAGSGIAQLAALLLMLAAALLAVTLVAAASACFLTIVQDTAAGHDKVEPWPGVPITDWMRDVFYVVNGLLSAALPGILLGGIFMCLGGSVRSAIYGGTLSSLALFPVFLISMITEGSCFAIASPAVWSTLRTAWRLWGVFYLLSAGLALLLFVLTRWLASGEFFLNGLSSAAAVAVAMIYFRLLGRLARRLSERPPS